MASKSQVILAVMAYGLYPSFDVRSDEKDEVDKVKALILRLIGRRAPMGAVPRFSFEVSRDQFQDLESGKCLSDYNFKDGSRVNVYIYWERWPPAP